MSHLYKNIIFVNLFISLILINNNLFILLFIPFIIISIFIYLYKNNINIFNINIEDNNIKQPIKNKVKETNKSSELDNLFNTIKIEEIKVDSVLPPLSILGIKEILLDTEESIINKANSIIKELDKFKISLVLNKIMRNSKLNLILFNLKDGYDNSGNTIPADVSKFLLKEKQIRNKLMTSSVRLLDVIEGTECVGVEFPNTNAQNNLLSLANLITSEEYKSYDKYTTIPLALGERTNGNPFIVNLMDAPHMLIGGATGSGKSVLLSIIISNLLFNYTEKEIELYLIDPKLVEFSIFEKLKHLGLPISKTAEEANAILMHLIGIMKERYSLFEQNKVKNINSFNNKNPEKKLKRIICIIDELADIMESNVGKEFENNLNSLLRLARASGIYIIFATQRPSADILSGEIKSNAPLKIALKTATQTDSNVILNKAGAETLIGKGDSLISFNGKIERMQCAYISEEELFSLMDYLTPSKSL